MPRIQKIFFRYFIYSYTIKTRTKENDTEKLHIIMIESEIQFNFQVWFVLSLHLIHYPWSIIFP